ncbi:MAG: hypothetical protein Q8P67_02930 [archaeon]|nr:hypothetical protein [archaeon]
MTVRHSASKRAPSNQRRPNPIASAKPNRFYAMVVEARERASGAAASQRIGKGLAGKGTALFWRVRPVTGHCCPAKFKPVPTSEGGDGQ